MSADGETMFLLLLVGAWVVGMWCFTNYRSDDEYGSAPGLVEACFLCPPMAPVWVVKYWLGYWGNTYGLKYYSWFNMGRGHEARPEPLAARAGCWCGEHLL